MAVIGDNTTPPEKIGTFPALENHSINARQYSDLLDTFKAIHVILSAAASQGPTLPDTVETYLHDFIDIINAEMALFAGNLKAFTPANENDARIRAYALIRYEADTWNLSISQIAKLVAALETIKG